MTNELTKEAQTQSSFSDKWNQNKKLVFSDTLRKGSDIYNWILTRNGFADAQQLSDFLTSKKRVLDAGCGNGRVTALLAEHSSKEKDIVGIDLTANVAAENLSAYSNVKVLQKDLMGDLSNLGKFDFIYCQEVLHHTSNPKSAFLNLCKLLTPEGEIAIYVYKKKAPVREFVDDMIRDKISSLPYQSAMTEVEEITQFGKILHELNAKVTLPEIKALEIPAGEYDIQRLFYHFFLKCFWNPELAHEENVAINYDWYHPQLCSRHTFDEVLQWFAEANLYVEHQYVDFYGITVRGRLSSSD